MLLWMHVFQILHHYIDKLDSTNNRQQEYFYGVVNPNGYLGFSSKDPLSSYFFETFSSYPL